MSWIFDLLHFLREQAQGAFGDLVELLCVYVMFVVLGLLYWLFTAKGKGKLALWRALEYLFPRKIYRHPSVRTDLLIVPVTAGFRILLLFLVTLPTADVVYDALLRSFGAAPFAVPEGRLSVALQVAVLYLAIDFMVFLVHYCQHKTPFLWRFHALHHSAEVLTPFTGLARFHPLDTLLMTLGSGVGSAVLAGFLLFLAGARPHAEAMTLLATLTLANMLVWQPFRHTHIWISLGWHLNHIFNAPCLHLIHHSALPEHRDKNMGDFLSVWDWMFGTLYVPKGREEFPQGIDVTSVGAKNPHVGFWTALLEPIASATQILLRR
jgi:sterol desaturase/sphingolipid hydroxylase (fatty acid hydroxylase superfamily)